MDEVEEEIEDLQAKQEIMRRERTKFALMIPPRLRFALAWTIFFIIVGIVIQSIQAGSFVFKDFFAKNYADWFRSFGSFTNPAAYGSVQNLVFAILGKWYYFLYTGGLISLIWAIIDSIINYEVYFK